MKMSICLSCAFMLLVTLWAWQNDSNIRSMIEQYVENGDIITFETRYTAERIVEEKLKDVVSGTDRSIQRAELKFHPHVLFEVKYSGADHRSKEGVLLWDLVDGEMVINCSTWEKTHGFEDAINAKANRNDFKIMHALLHPYGRGRSVDMLQRDLQIDREELQEWIESAKNKRLIVQRGNELQLHFENPKIAVLPQTSFDQNTVTKPYDHAQKFLRRYTIREIESISQEAFGDEFAIRSKREVFLPIWCIEISNPDGSTLSTHWNALTGKKIVR
jgi:hypothetical protein